MDKETLSHYGWIVILVLILSVLLAFASPFGTFIADGFKATYTGLFQTGDSAMDVVMNATGGCTHRETEVINVTADYSGDTVCKKCGLLMGTGKYLVPEGGTYTAADGTIYGPGDELPEVVTNGDSYAVSGHDYVYNYLEAEGGWGVHLSQSAGRNKQTYGEIYTSINGEPITYMGWTFQRCYSLVTAPEIPNTVTKMVVTFGDCTSLEAAPKIPTNIQVLDRTFSGCSSMKIAPDLSNCTKLYDMSAAFGSTGLTDLSDFIIPDSVTNMDSTFNNCASLTTAPVIPSNVTDVDYIFRNCPSLTGVITINANFPASVQSPFELSKEGKDIIITGSAPKLYYLYDRGTLYRNKTFVCKNVGTLTDGDSYYNGDYKYTFIDNMDGWKVAINSYVGSGKTSYGKILEQIENKPIVSLWGTFQSCSNLTESPEIPDTVTDMSRTFFRCPSLVVAPTIPNGVTTLDTAFCECTSLTTAPDISACTKLTNMSSTFSGCTNLKTYTGNMNTDGDFSNYSIPNSVTNMSYTFYSCSALTNAPTIPNNVNNMYGTFSNCTSLTGTVTINTNLGYYYNCFAGIDFEIQNLTLMGTSTALDGIGATGTNYCAECNGKCNGGH